jgi:protein-S-isoprenylcysteine O-methyltransferase Ste14
MHLPVKTILGILWAVAGAVWFVGALASKRTARAQSFLSRLFHLALGALAFLVGLTRFSEFDPLTRTFVPASPVFTHTGLLLTLAGISFAIWARFYLGGNWSGTITVKENHSLVRRGPMPSSAIRSTPAFS